MHVHKRNPIMALALLVSSAAAANSFAQEQPKPTADEAAIRQRAADYVAAIRRGDGAEIASFWTANGDYVDEAGMTVKGRVLAQQAKPPAANQDAQRSTVTVEAIRFITPDVAIEDGGISSSRGALSGSYARRYTAIWVRQKGKWLLDGLRESSVPVATHFDHLRELDWMVGDWISDDDGQTVRLSCKWTPDKNFLLREIDVRMADREPLHVTQRIGWDEREKQIKSWTFDSQGGHGDGLWFHKDKQWIIEAQSVLPDGGVASGTNVLQQDGDGAFHWESSNGHVDGQPVPEHKVRMVRTTSGR